MLQPDPTATLATPRSYSTVLAVSHNLNEAGGNQVKGIAIGNRLGPGIEIASLPELGEGGTWSTCTNGCNLDPPQARAVRA